MKIGDTVYFYLPKEFYDSEWVDGEARFNNISLTLNDFLVIKSLIGFEKAFEIVSISDEGVSLEGLDGHWPLDLLVKHSSKEVK